MAMIRLRHSETVSIGFSTKESGLIDNVQVVHSTQSALLCLLSEIYTTSIYSIFPTIFSLVGVGVVGKISSMVFDDLLVGSPLFLPKNERTMTSDSLPKLGSKSVARVAWGP